MSKSYLNENKKKLNGEQNFLFCFFLPAMRLFFMRAGQMGFMVSHFDLYPDLEAVA